MRVLYLLNTTIMGGGNISFINMITLLYEKGIAVYIAHPDSSVDREFYNSTKDIVSGYFHVRMGSWFLDKSEKTFKKKIKNIYKKIIYLNDISRRIETSEVKKVIKKVRPDLIHTNVGVLRAGYYAANEMGIPHVWHVREYQTKDFGWMIYPSKEKYEELLNDSNVITITKDILDYYGLNGSSTARCIYNGCFSKKELADIYPKKRYFLCCSRISKEKIF